MKLHIVLRTCDKTSIRSDRIVDKKECVIRCFNSLHTSVLQANIEYHIHVIDDNSSIETKNILKHIAPDASFSYHQSQSNNLNAKQKSRATVKLAYDYIKQLPDEDLVYLVEDDYLHYINTIELMIDAWKYFTTYMPNISIGIFPQDFTELYPHPNNPFNDTYVRPCIVIPGPDRYYRTTWFTHESFMVPVGLIKKYATIFDQLLTIGTIEGNWEGNTISQVWTRPDVCILMPMPTLVFHLGRQNDISNYTANDWQRLWEKNQISL